MLCKVDKFYYMCLWLKHETQSQVNAHPKVIDSIITIAAIAARDTSSIKMEQIKSVATILGLQNEVTLYGMKTHDKIRGAAKVIKLKSKSMALRNIRKTLIKLGVLKISGEAQTQAKDTQAQAAYCQTETESTQTDAKDIQPAVKDVAAEAARHSAAKKLAEYNTIDLSQLHIALQKGFPIETVQSVVSVLDKHYTVSSCAMFELGEAIADGLVEEERRSYSQLDRESDYKKRSRRRSSPPAIDSTPRRLIAEHPQEARRTTVKQESCTIL